MLHIMYVILRIPIIEYMSIAIGAGAVMVKIKIRTILMMGIFLMMHLLLLLVRAITRKSAIIQETIK